MSVGRLLHAAVGLGLVLALAAQPCLADPLAVVAALKGKVEVVSGKGTRTRAAFGQPLERGDRVQVPAGGSATLFFNDGNVVELAERSSVTVGGRVAPRGTATANVPPEVYRQTVAFVTGGTRQQGTMALSNLRGGEDQKPFLLSPRGTDLLEDRPALEWRAVEGAVRYRVTVSGEGGELWTREAAAARLDYPADAPTLARDADYLWELEAFSERGSLKRESSAFHVMSEAEAAAVKANLARIRESAGPDSPAALYLSGSYLFGRGLFAAAAAQFEALSRAAPDSPAPHEALGRVYREVGLMDRAASEFQQALALTRE